MVRLIFGKNELVLRAFSESLRPPLPIAWPFMTIASHLPRGQIDDPSSLDVKILYLSAPLLISVSHPLRAFEQTRSPSRALNSPHALLPELQRHRDSVRCVAQGEEVSGHKLPKQLKQTLIVCL